MAIHPIVVSLKSSGSQANKTNTDILRATLLAQLKIIDIQTTKRTKEIWAVIYSYKDVKYNDPKHWHCFYLLHSPEAWLGLRSSVSSGHKNTDEVKEGARQGRI